MKKIFQYTPDAEVSIDIGTKTPNITFYVMNQSGQHLKHFLRSDSHNKRVVENDLYIECNKGKAIIIDAYYENNFSCVSGRMTKEDAREFWEYLVEIGYK